MTDNNCKEEKKEIESGWVGFCSLHNKLMYECEIERLKAENAKLRAENEVKTQALNSIVKCQIHSLMSCCCQIDAEQAMTARQGI